MCPGTSFVLLLVIVLCSFNTVKTLSQNCHNSPPISGKNIEQGTVTLQNEWPAGFQAKITFQIPEDINGWEIILTFSKYVTNFQTWKAATTATSGTTFVLHEMSWNAQLIKETTFDLSFLAYKSGDTPHQVCADLVWNSGTAPATNAPTTSQRTNAPTTSQPIDTNAPTTSQPIDTNAPTTSQPTNAPTASQPIVTNAPTTSQPIDTNAPTTSQPTNAPTASQPIVTNAPTTSQPIDTNTPTTSQPIDTNAPTTVPPSPCASGKYNYNEVLHKSILFYEAQRSGKLPSNNRISWRGDSALGDKGSNGEDLTGGWYDAGDHVKFGFPMAFSTTLLSWGLVEYSNAYTAAGELQTMLDSIKSPLDYFIKAHVSEHVLYGQLGNGGIDHAYWGRPEDMSMSRPAYKIDRSAPGSDLAAETAAAMAAGSIAFRNSDTAYADVLLSHAEELYRFADQFRGKYSDSISDAANFYSSSSYNDELVWGAAWLYKATGDNSYLQKAEQYFSQFGLGNAGWAFSWDEKTAGVQMLLYDLTSNNVYRSAIEKSLDSWLPGGSVHYTPKGLAWRIQWGPTRYAANTAFLALLAADKGLKSTSYRQFGEAQIHYMLGDSGRSYVVGFGNNPPQRPHHRSSSCPNEPSPCDWSDYNNLGANPQVLYGALVGGPDQNDNYQDNRNDYIMNEVACDYNAGFQSAVAALKSKELTSC